MSETDETALFTDAMLSAAVDPSLPFGVIGIKDGAGLAWRYPLAEFSIEGAD